ncbi:MAG: hypothetical protein RMJ59_03525 [Candidatus Nitrosocaldus sp.]|nr:hypothetical protein [Candidatus Nitrosocaldus sp.]MCS7141003.1 hypothetical protein [Candidatus Nitrosocaldus sp.]MDW7999919.1 hypothetical protein [Candidatus Nitrosocaldus sp.]MDW8275436.1 hypothetical protein [Candidatus Nitrosocaldus sp.]
MHPSQVPVIHSFVINDPREVMDAIGSMLMLYEQHKAVRFRVLLPKDDRARGIGYALLNGLNLRIRHMLKGSNIRYVVYHHDSSHYALLLLDEDSASTFMV